jgi:hypothetical protein
MEAGSNGSEIAPDARRPLRVGRQTVMSRRIGLAVACAGVIGALCGSPGGAAAQAPGQGLRAHVRAEGLWAKLAGGVWHRTFTFTPRMSLRIPAHWKWIERDGAPRTLEFYDPRTRGQEYVDVFQPRKAYDAAGNVTYLRPDLIAFFRRNNHLHLGPTSTVVVGGVRGRQADGVATSQEQCNDQPFQNTGSAGVPFLELRFPNLDPAIDPSIHETYSFTECLDNGLRFRLIDLSVRGKRIVFVIAHVSGPRGESFLGTVEGILHNARFTSHTYVD